MTTLIARLTAVLAAVLLLAGCSGAGEAPADGSDASDGSEAPLITGEPSGYNEADIAFANAMVPHHAQAIDLSRTAVEKSGNPDLVALAEQIIAVAQPEMNILNVFLVQWNENPDIRTGPEGSEAPDAGQATPGTIDEATVARLGSLSGPEFDRLWLQSMISQHRGAIEIADAEIADGANVDAISIAETIAAGQRGQIEKMTQILEGMP
ncbi:DUF305 domain-containing protein [Mycobacterium sp. ZZG]